MNPLDVLSNTERQVADCLLEGMTVSEISKRLSISYQLAAETSKTIKQKLKVSTIAEVKRLAGHQV